MDSIKEIVSICKLKGKHLVHSANKVLTFIIFVNEKIRNLLIGCGFSLSVYRKAMSHRKSWSPALLRNPSAGLKTILINHF